jgi:hypothetical protein
VLSLRQLETSWPLSIQAPSGASAIELTRGPGRPGSTPATTVASTAGGTTQPDGTGRCTRVETVSTTLSGTKDDALMRSADRPLSSPTQSEPTDRG